MQNESAVKVTDGGVYTLTDSIVSTTGDTSSMDDSSFSGLNAAILAESGSKITLSNVKVTTTGSGANGVLNQRSSRPKPPYYLSGLLAGALIQSTEVHRPL
jgi:hypothetical protein